MLATLFDTKRWRKSIVKGDIRATVWEKHKLVYLRMPKSGNTSIRAAIEGGVDRRLFLRQIKELQRQGWTIFSFVRNPWSRMVSTYVQKASSRATSKRIENGIYQGFIESGIAVTANMSFSEFCQVTCQVPDDRTDKHLRSQYHTLVRNGEPIASYIGKLETIKADWQCLMANTGLDFTLPHHNRTSNQGPHYSEYYQEDHLIDLVAERYVDDIRYFDYSFERR